MVKLIKILWLLLSVGIAIWGIQSGGETQLVAIYLIGVLTMPLGLVVYVVGSLALSELTSNSGSHGMTIDILMHMLAILSGYIQWFVLLPKIVNRMKNERFPKAWVLVLVGLVAIVYGLYQFYLHVFPGSH